jgi:hypothetical protein
MPAGGKDETAIEVQGKEEEPVDLDSSLIWAIRYLECETVESMLSEGKRLTLYHRGPAWVDPHAASDSGLRAPVRWFIRGGAPCRPAWWVAAGSPFGRVVCGAHECMRSQPSLGPRGRRDAALP